jgi:hypothetical protein
MYVGLNPSDPLVHVLVCWMVAQDTPPAGLDDEYAVTLVPADTLDHRGVTQDGCGVEQLA